MSYLPHFISTVVVVGMLLEIFKTAGVANTIITSLGFSKQLFFTQPEWFRSLYIGSD